MATISCRCGSGLPRRSNVDARGIFLCYTCDKCHAEKMRGYRSEVLTNPQYKAQDLGDDDDWGEDYPEDWDMP